MGSIKPDLGVFCWEGMGLLLARWIYMEMGDLVGEGMGLLLARWIYGVVGVGGGRDLQAGKE